MKININNKTKSRIEVTVELTGEKVDKYFEEATEKLAGSVKLPGFRSGKTPVEVAKNHIDNKELIDEAINLAVRECWQAASKDLKEAPISEPEVNIDKFEQGKDARIVFSYDIRPEVKLGDYKKIKVKVETKKEVDNKEVDQVVEGLALSKASEIAKNEGAEKADKIVIDFQGSVDGKKLDKLTSKNFAVIIGETGLIAGFDDELIGLKKGEKKTFSVTFPKDYFDKEMTNKKATFEVEAKEVYRLVKPDLDDKFAEGFGKKTLQELWDLIKDNMVHEKAHEYEAEAQNKWLEQFEKLVNCDLPNSLVEREAGRFEESWQKFVSERGMTADMWLERRGTTIDKMREDWHKEAGKSVKIGLGMSELAKDKNIKLDSDEDYRKLLEEVIKEAVA